MVFPRASKLFGRPFGTERGVTQGDPVSPTIFNIVVDSMIREVMLELCGHQKAHHGMGWAVGEHNTVLYAGDGRIAGSNTIWF